MTALTVSAGCVRHDTGLGALNLDQQHPDDVIERVCSAIRAAGAEIDDVVSVMLTPGNLARDDAGRIMRTSITGPFVVTTTAVAA